MKSRCERPSLPSQLPTRGTDAGVFALLPVPHPQAPASPAGNLLAKLGELGGAGGGQKESPSPGGLLRAEPGCCGLRTAALGIAAFSGLTAVRRQKDIPTCQRNPKPLPTPPRSPQHPLSQPSAWCRQHVRGCALSSHQSPQPPSALARVPSQRYSH